MNNYTQLTNIIDELKANGVTPKVTRLKARKPRKGEATMSRVGGAKTAYRPSIKMGNGGNRHMKGWHIDPFHIH